MVTRVVATVAATYYGTYVFTMVATLIGAKRGTIPQAGPQYFNLGRWLVPLAWIGIGWPAIVILYLAFPPVHHRVRAYTVYFLILCILLCFLYPRPRIPSGVVGPPPARPPVGGSVGGCGGR